MFAFWAHYFNFKMSNFIEIQLDYNIGWSEGVYAGHL